MGYRKNKDNLCVGMWTWWYNTLKFANNSASDL